MPDSNGLSLSGADIAATAGQTRLVNSVMKLYKQGFTPSPSSTQADFAAHECDFDGYAPATIAAWAAPILAGVGWAIYAPTQTFRWAHVLHDVGNSVGGHWIEDAGGHLIDYAIYDPAVPCTGPGQAVVKTPVEIYPAGVQ